MIQLKINDTWLDLLPDTSINMKRNNPLFGDDVSIPGEYTLPFDLPLTGKNRKALGFPDVLQNKEVPANIDGVQLFFDGIYFKKGRLRFGKIKNPYEGIGTVPANFTFGLSRISEPMKEKSIRDLASETITLYTPSYQKKVYVRFNNTASYNDSGDHEININGSIYGVTVSDINSATHYTDLRDAINAESEDNNCVATYNSTGGPWSGKHLELTPYDSPTDIETPFQVIVGPLGTLIEVFGNEPWQVETNYEDHWSEFNTAVSPYLEEGSEPNDKIRFLPVQNDIIFDGVLASGYPVNSNKAGDFLKNYPRSSSQTQLDGFFNWDKEAVNRLVVVPFVRLAYVMDLIAAELGISFVGDFIDSNAYDKAVIYNMKSISLPLPFTSEKVNTPFHHNTVTLSDHLPDIKINDFLKGLKSRFILNVEYIEERQEIRMNYIEDVILTKTYKDITSKAGIISSWENSDVTSIRLSANQGSQDELAKEETYTVVGELTGGEKELPSKLGSIVNMISSTRHGSIPWVAQQEGEQKDFKIIFDAGERLVFFWSIGDGSTSWTVRGSTNTASPGYLFTSTTKKTAFLNMLLKQKIIELQPNFTIVDLSNLDWEEKLRVGEVNYLVHSLDITLTMKGHIDVKMVLSTVI